MNVFSIIATLLAPLLAVILVSIPLFYAIKKRTTSIKKPLIVNLCLYFGVLLLAVIVPIGGYLDVSAAAEAVAESVGTTATGLGYLAAALSVGLGSIGCGIAVGGAAPAAIGAVAEEPESFAKAMIFVVLGEGVAIYGVLIAILILGAL
jgi:V/A-type H+-transporting ATPase subunit K